MADSHFGSIPRNPDTLIIACMDRRLSAEIDEENVGNAIVLRNAGANVSAPTMEKAIRQVLSETDIVNVVLMPHMDCGAMGLVSSAILEKKSVDPHVYSDLVQQFAQTKFNTRDVLEAKVNPKLQLERLSEIVDDMRKTGQLRDREVNLSCKVLDPRKMTLPADDHEHSVMVSKPSGDHYRYLFDDINHWLGKERVGMGSTYVVSPFDESSVMIATKVMGIKDVFDFDQMKAKSKKKVR